MTHTTLILIKGGSSWTLELTGPASWPDALEDDPERLGVLRVITPEGTPPCQVEAPTTSRAVEDLDSELGPRLWEQTRYDILLQTSNSLVELYHADPQLLSGLQRSRTGVLYGSLNFGGQVGTARFEIRVNGQTELILEVEIFPTKLSYRADYERLVADVQRLSIGLMLDWLRATFQHGSATTHAQGPPSELEWMLHLGHRLGDLECALRHIAAQPQRQLRQEPEWQRAERVRRVDSRVRSAARRGEGQGPWVAAGAVALRTKLRAARATPTLDTPEHRWIAAQLERIRRRLARLLREVDVVLRTRGSERLQQQQAELFTMERRVVALLRLEPFAATTAPPHPGFTSLTLMATPGYAEATQLLHLLQLKLQLEGEALELSLQDLHVLYELWCFLKVVELISSLRAPQDNALDLSELLRPGTSGLRLMLRRGQSSEVSVQLGSGRKVTATYNRTFSGDVLFEQRPDITLQIEGGGWPPMHLILDAKYRLDASAASIKRYGTPAPPQEALGVLYRYRDAILSRTNHHMESGQRTVVQAAALYPWSPRNPEHRAHYMRQDLWGCLQRTGVGAIPLLPTDDSLLHTWLHNALGQSPWDLALLQGGETQRNRDAWLRAAEEVVLIGALRGEDPTQHLHWCLDEKRYYFPRLKQQPRQHRVRYVALYIPGRLTNGRGAVSYLGQVTHIEELPRARVQTPWPSRRRQHEHVVLYHIESWIPLTNPILHDPSTSSPLRGHRWSSGLALKRAATLDELSLESAAEWELVDALRARNIPFSVRAAALSTTQASPRSHALLILPDAQAQIWHEPLNGYCATFNSSAESIFTLSALLTSIARRRHLESPGH